VLENELIASVTNISFPSAKPISAVGAWVQGNCIRAQRLVPQGGTCTTSAPRKCVVSLVKLRHNFSTVDTFLRWLPFLCRNFAAHSTPTLGLERTENEPLRDSPCISNYGAVRSWAIKDADSPPPQPHFLLLSCVSHDALHCQCIQIRMNQLFSIYAARYVFIHAAAGSAIESGSHHKCCRCFNGRLGLFAPHAGIRSDAVTQPSDTTVPRLIYLM
jgi:hypothetical protein